MTDYLAMSDADAIQACGQDAAKWADWYCQCAESRGEQADRGFMQTWFANAMMAVHDNINPDDVVRFISPEQRASNIALLKTWWNRQ